ncbi:Gfo/Idh/MocA family oxidoreductase [Tessaracoccus terricola]
MTAQPVNVILVGAGHRTMIYGSYANEAPERMRVVGVVDPDPIRRGQAAEEFQLTRDQQWAAIAELPEAGEWASAAINGTMDRVHVATAVELLDKGFDVLLEKPISTDAEDLFVLAEAARRTERLVHVCHVLRHAPFYRKVREVLLGGAVGRVINIQMAENVAYDHMAVSYVRGSFSNSSRSGSTMLLAKSCHDLDLMTWLVSGNQPVRATSVGSRMFFREENAPEGSGERCLVDCQIESRCAYSAKRHYVDNGWWPFYAWQSIEELGPEPTREQKLESLRGDNPYGRCVWRTDTDLVDHQVVTVEFADGATGSLSMIGNSAAPSRTLHIVGTEGELFGELHSGEFTVRRIPSSGSERSLVEHHRKTVDGDDMHGGGDLRLVADFVDVLTGGAPSISTTSLSDSINGHLIGFAAERARIQGRWVPLDEMAPASSPTP